MTIGGNHPPMSIRLADGARNNAGRPDSNPRANRHDERYGHLERHPERGMSVSLAANVSAACRRGDSLVWMRHVDDGETVDPCEVARVAGMDR